MKKIKNQIALLFLASILLCNCQKETIRPLEIVDIKKPSIDLTDKILITQTAPFYQVGLDKKKLKTNCNLPACQKTFDLYKERFQRLANQNCQPYQFKIECCSQGIDATLVLIIIQPDKTNCQKNNLLSLSKNQSKDTGMHKLE